MPFQYWLRSISGEDRSRASRAFGKRFRTRRPGDTLGFYMWRKYRVLFGLLLGSVVYAADPPEGLHTPSKDSIFVLERFDYPDHIGKLPDTWEGRTGWGRVGKKDLYYTVQTEDDDFFLRASTTGKAINVGRKANINLRIFNRLRWRWRVFKLPQDGNEQIKDKNDSAAAVRLVFHGGIIPKTLKYVWSATLPVGAETESPVNSRTKVIVLESGSSKLGEWVWEERDAYEDYKRLFGGEPRRVKFLAVITDSDNTRSPVIADYDDFTFLIGPPDTIKTAPPDSVETQAQ